MNLQCVAICHVELQTSTVSLVLRDNSELQEQKGCEALPENMFLSGSTGLLKGSSLQTTPHELTYRIWTVRRVDTGPIEQKADSRKLLALTIAEGVHELG